jgi:hypothetical protein
MVAYFNLHNRAFYHRPCPLHKRSGRAFIITFAVDTFRNCPAVESGVSGYTDYIRLQLQTTGSTPSGAVNQKTFCFQYDEV